MQGGLSQRCSANATSGRPKASASAARWAKREPFTALGRTPYPPLFLAPPKGTHGVSLHTVRFPLNEWLTLATAGKEQVFHPVFLPQQGGDCRGSLWRVCWVVSGHGGVPLLSLPRAWVCRVRGLCGVPVPRADSRGRGGLLWRFCGCWGRDNQTCFEFFRGSKAVYVGLFCGGYEPRARVCVEVVDAPPLRHFRSSRRWGTGLGTGSANPQW